MVFRFTRQFAARVWHSSYVRVPALFQSLAVLQWYDAKQIEAALPVHDTTHLSKLISSHKAREKRYEELRLEAALRFCTAQVEKKLSDPEFHTAFIQKVLARPAFLFQSSDNIHLYSIDATNFDSHSSSEFKQLVALLGTYPRQRLPVSPPSEFFRGVSFYVSTQYNPSRIQVFCSLEEHKDLQ